jgi:hypothetical protein
LSYVEHEEQMLAQARRIRDYLPALGARLRELEAEINDLKDSLWLWWGDAANVMGFEHAEPEERHDAYRRYRIEVVAQPDGGVYMTGAFGGEPFFGLSETPSP